MFQKHPELPYNLDTIREACERLIAVTTATATAAETEQIHTWAAALIKKAEAMAI